MFRSYGAIVQLEHLVASGFSEASCTQTTVVPGSGKISVVEASESWVTCEDEKNSLTSTFFPRGLVPALPKHDCMVIAEHIMVIARQPTLKLT